MVANQHDFPLQGASDDQIWEPPYIDVEKTAKTSMGSSRIKFPDRNREVD